MLALAKLSLNRGQLTVFWLLVAIMPWFAAGRDPLGLIVLYFTLLLGAFLVWRLPDVRGIGRNLLTVFFWLWLTWLGLSLIWSVNRFQTTSQLILWVLALAAFSLAYSVKHNFAVVEGWIRGYLLVTAIFSLYGMGLYLIEGYERLTSTFYWANPFAAYLIPAVLLAFWNYAKSGRFWLYLAGTINGAAFILTDSRSAYLIMALIALVAVVKLRKPKEFWIKLLYIAISAILLSTILGQIRAQLFKQPTVTPGSRFVEAAQGESTSGSDRLNYLSSSLAIWRDFPLAGTGAGTFATAHPQYQKRVISAAAHPHNFYALSLAESGGVGLLLLLGVLVGLALGAYRAVRIDRRLAPLVVSLIALLVHLGLDIDSNYPSLVILIATLAGLVYLPKSPKTSPARYPSLVLSLLLLIVLPTVSLFQSRQNMAYGRISQDNQDYQQAADYYQKAHLGVTYNPDSFTAEGINYFTLASLEEESGQNLNLAESRARLAVGQDPWDSQHAFFLGRVMQQKKQFLGAEEAYKKAIELDPLNHPEYYQGLANLYLLANRPADVLKVTTSILPLYPAGVIANRSADPTIPETVSNLYVSQAVAHNRQGEIAATRADLERALKINPDNNRAKALLERVSTQ